ncbi:hypothetical protein [Pseudomonas migulae]
MAILIVSGLGDRVSELAALAQALNDWLAKQPQQRHQPMRVTMNRHDDGSLAGFTVEALPPLELVK